MNIAPGQAERLKRYFLNARPFLWGVLKAKNKQGRLKELQGMSCLTDFAPGSNPVYDKINRDLLLKLGITGILEEIVVPRIRTVFSPETLRYFRDCWDQGKTPEVDYLVKQKLYRKRTFTTIVPAEVYDGWPGTAPIAGYRDAAFIFLQIERQFNVIEGWTIFAAMWFEDIEPSLR